MDPSPARSSTAISGVTNGGIEVSDCYNVQILYNTVQNVGTSPLFVKFVSTGSEYMNIASNQFQGNTLYDILLTGFPGSPPSYFQNNAVSGATVDVFGGNATGVGSTRNLFLCNNTISGTSGDGVAISDTSGNGSVSNVVVSGNTINNTQANGVNVRSGMYIYVNSNNISNAGTSTSPGTGVCLETSSNIFIANNTIST